MEVDIKMTTISEQWWTSGMIFKDRLVCQFHKSGFTAGLFYGQNPLNNPTSIVLFEMFLIFIFTRTIHFLLQPLRQSMIVAQIIAGFMMGPIVLTRNRALVNELFPPAGTYILKTVSNFGFILHLFIMGVKIDVSGIRGTRAKSLVIGLSGLLFSLSIGAFAFYIVRQHTKLDQSLFTGIRVLIAFNSLNFFMVTSGYIYDLKFSNSELGRLACSSSLVVDLLGLLGNTVSLTWFGNADTTDMASRLMSFISVSFYYAVLFSVLRPLVLYVVSKTPQGATTMKQTHLMVVLIILMLAWLWGEALGQRFATFLFGLSLPDGPPLGSALVQKLELFTSGVLLPVFCTMAGWKTNIFSWKEHSQFWDVELVFVIGHLSKLLGIFLSSTALGMSFRDGLSLSLMMSFKGVMEVAILNAWSDRGILDDRLFSLSMMNIVLFTGATFPLVRHLYDPWKQYSSTRKKKAWSIDETRDLRVLVCIHNEESMPGIVNLLKLVSNLDDTLTIFTLQLIHLTGSLMPILGPVYKYKKWGANLGHYGQTMNAFNQLETKSEGLIRVHNYISVTPYKSMHNDICSVAYDKRTNLIITPFYKIRGPDENWEICSHYIKQVNIRMILQAPCSVGILIDKKEGVRISKNKGFNGRNYQITMLFIGGCDDHEALVLAKRMSQHQNVRLSVIWLRSKQEYEEDVEIMTNFHIKAKYNNQISLEEKYVNNGLGTTEIVLSMHHVDLLIVGKHHEPECPAIQGLIDWNESQELGVLGDMLATFDFQFSILIVQK